MSVPSTVCGTTNMQSYSYYVNFTKSSANEEEPLHVLQVYLE